MKNLRNLSLFILLLMAILGLQAQNLNGNAVVSDVHVYDLGNGTGRIEVHVSGNLAASVHEGTFVISGVRIPSGSATGGIGESITVIEPEQPPGNGNGNINGNQAVILTGLVPLTNGGGNNSHFHIEVRLVFGSGSVSSRVDVMRDGQITYVH